MSSDNFTGSDGDALGGNWGNVTSGFLVADCKIQSNTASCDSTTTHDFGARYTTSSVDLSQIVFKAGSYTTASKRVCVRANGTTAGYWATFEELTGDSFGTLSIYKDDATWIDSSPGSWLRTSDHTVKITASGTGSVTLNAWVDDVNVIVDAVDGTSTIDSGNPGFFCNYIDIDEAAYRFDDWTDAPGLVANTLSADTGAYSYTGTDATLGLDQDYTMSADAGAYTYTGTAATLTSTAIKTLTADAGNYTYSGTDANVIYTTTVVGTAGVYAFTGTDAVPDWSVSTDLTLVSDAGSYSVTGADVLLTFGEQTLTLAPDAGAYRFLGGRTTLTLVQSTQWSPISDKTPGWSPDADASTTWTPDTDKSTTWV